jgi:hypothetical protein
MQFPLLILLLFLVSCTPSPPKGEGSLLIIAVSNFRADDLACGLSGDVITPHIDIICNESVRFTHAYTPSVLEVPALASILTGLYPMENGVQTNGSSQYLNQIKSLPQWAHSLGMETFFVSGGVPALRKTAISKGFADFDDSIRSNGSFYRKATTTVSKLISLIENRSGETPFLGVAQLVDLAFPETVLFESDREEGSIGKIEEIDSAIGLLREEFTRLKIWDSLTVVIVGLQGNEQEAHGGLSKGLNLYDEVVRVPLIIKPSRKPRDQGPSWKVDSPVTLVDLGVTLLNFIKAKSFLESQFSTLNLLPALQGKELGNQDRFIFSESDLPRWRGWGPRLLAVRSGEWKYFLPPEAKLFNTYTDHLELRDLNLIDPNSALRLRNETEKNLGSMGVDKALLENVRPMPTSVADKLRVAKIIFSKTFSVEEKLRSLTELEVRRPQDWQVLQWHVNLLTESKNWNELRDLVAKKRPLDRSTEDELQLWKTFIHLQLKTKNTSEVTRTDSVVNCLYLALALKRFSLNELESFQDQQLCKDPETQNWTNAFINFRLKHIKEAVSFFELAHALTEKRIDQTGFARSFWSDGAVWDYNPNLPEGPAVFSLFNALVNNAEFSEFIKRKQLP